MRLITTRRQLIAGAAALAVAPWARAAGYPDKPIRLIVPFSPGGTLDIMARLIADEMSASMKQPVVVENRAGASGAIGAAYVAQAPADGYTVLFTAALLSQLPTVMKLSFNVVQDLVPVYNAMANAQIVFANPSFPPNNLTEFVRYVKEHPGTQYASGAGDRSALHFSMQMLANSVGARMEHIPYKGASEAVKAAVANLVPLAIGGPQPGMMLVKEGKLKTLAVLGGRRSHLLPDVPALSEAGVPTLDFYVNWLGTFVPKGTPAEVVATLNKELAAACNQPKVVERAHALAMEPEPYNTPHQFAAQVSHEVAEWREASSKVQFN